MFQGKLWIFRALLPSLSLFPSGFFVAWWLRLNLWRLKPEYWSILVLLHPNYNTAWAKSTVWQWISYGVNRKGIIWRALLVFLLFLFSSKQALWLWHAGDSSMLCCFCWMLQTTTRQTVRKWVCEGMNNKKYWGFNKMGKHWRGKGTSSIKNGQCVIDGEGCAGKH